MTKERKVQTIHFHKKMDPNPVIEVYTHTLNGELIKGVSIALYSTEPETDWCVSLTKEEALLMARKIIATYEEGEITA
jgi:hypothetical protein